MDVSKIYNETLENFLRDIVKVKEDAYEKLKNLPKLLVNINAIFDKEDWTIPKGWNDWQEKLFFKYYEKIIMLILYLSKSLINHIIHEYFFFQISFQFAYLDNLSFENLMKQIIDEYIIDEDTIDEIIKFSDITFNIIIILFYMSGNFIF